MELLQQRHLRGVDVLLGLERPGADACPATPPGGRILGATIVAERAGELIHEPALAMATGMFTGRLAATSHAYPTWSMAVQLAAAQFFMSVD
jgi:hypothetical protein